MNYKRYFIPKSMVFITIVTYNRKDFLLDYIDFNPMKHYNIAPKDWMFSTFNKFVKNNFYTENWCNYEDKNSISKMELE